MSKLVLETEGDRHVIVKRRFVGTPEELYRAHLDPELMRQWMTGPDGWQVDRCTCEGKPGGKMRIEWSDGRGNGFYLTGEILELEPPRRIVHVERMHLPDPTPDNHIETTFTADGDGTLLVARMTLPDAATRKTMLETGMEHGMEASYARLDGICGE